MFVEIQPLQAISQRKKRGDPPGKLESVVIIANMAHRGTTHLQQLSEIWATGWEHHLMSCELFRIAGQGHVHEILLFFEIPERGHHGLRVIVPSETVVFQRWRRGALFRGFNQHHLGWWGRHVGGRGRGLGLMNPVIRLVPNVFNGVQHGCQTEPARFCRWSSIGRLVK